MKRFILIAISVMPIPANAERGFTIEIGVHQEVNYSANEAGQTLSVLRRELSNRCGAFNFFTPTMTNLDNSLPRDVDGGSQSVLRQFASTETSIQIVPAIVACPTPPVNGIILGCARPKGPILVVKRSNRQRDAQVWAHEIGHAQGLGGAFSGYVEGHNTEFGSLMYRAAGTANWGMIDAECDQYFRSQNFPPAVNAATEEIVLPDLPEDEASSNEGLPQQILGADWPHGFDFAWVERIGEPLITASESAIDEADVGLWPNAVLVIGYANAEGALDRLIRVLSFEEAEEPDRLSLNEAKANAALSLGYLAFHGNSDALSQLSNLTSPNLVQNSIPVLGDGREPGEVARQIARTSTVGLAIAATQYDEAAAMLEEQRFRQERGAFDLGVDDQYFDSLDNITTSLRENGLRFLIDGVNLP